MTISIDYITREKREKNSNSEDFNKQILLEIKELKFNYELDQIRISNINKKNQLSKLRKELDRVKDDIIKKRNMVKNIENRISYILGSKSWKITSPIRRVGKIIKK